MLLTFEKLVQLAERTGLPIADVDRIVRLGTPWPLVSDRPHAGIHAEAAAAGVSIHTATMALNSLARLEREQLAALGQAATEALMQAETPQVASELPDFVALMDSPAVCAMQAYSEHLASVFNLDPMQVYRVYVALVNYAAEHKGWDPEGTGFDVRPTSS